ncbi:E3 ubiquitin-protein ligase RHA2A-like [Magnolia sinica]|uniref:E3 ubiquitin-protein ligase RHA2A-like n=1 Tax=Magnolia sinica TaxID=86752 RepID=UPI00265A8433|nr:E3 ubiquitin-protein ligase RHA2A-like [Magnolia sinica]
MGLPGDLSNVSSDSIPILLVALAAHCVCYLKSLIFCLFQSIGFSRLRGSRGDVIVGGDRLFGAVGSGLAGLIVLTEQLKVSRVYTFRKGGSDDGDGDAGPSDCVVCLCGLRDGDQVRRLACCHVFHKVCLEGWFDHQNLNCPLCRAPLVSEEERVVETEQRVGA